MENVHGKNKYWVIIKIFINIWPLSAKTFLKLDTKVKFLNEKPLMTYFLLLYMTFTKWLKVYVTVKASNGII